MPMTDQFKLRNKVALVTGASYEGRAHGNPAGTGLR
jgi:hypothetical protein